jgi:hypothetical protein
VAHRSPEELIDLSVVVAETEAPRLFARDRDLEESQSHIPASAAFVQHGV